MPPASRLPLAILTFGSSLLFAALLLPLTAGRVSGYDDLSSFHLPMRAHYAACLAAGHDPAWMPGMFCGFDAHAEGQVGMTHPLHGALYRFLPLEIGFQIEAMIALPLMLLGTYVWLRGRGLATDAALLGGFALAFSGFSLGHVCHINATQVLAHLPWMLAAIDTLVDGSTPRRRAGGALALGLLTGSELLLGYPQYVVINGLAVLAYGAITIRRWTAVATIALAHGFGLLIGMVQLLPTAEALRESVRATPDLGFRGSYSLHPAHLVQVFAGHYLHMDVEVEQSVGCGLFVGVAVLLLPVLPAGRLRWLAVVLVVAGWFLALGRHNPLFGFWSALPPLSKFRCPSRYLALVQFGAAVATAVAWQTLFRSGNARPPLSGPLLAGIAVVVTVVGLLPMAAADGFESIRQTSAGIADAASGHPHQPSLFTLASRPRLLLGVGLLLGFVGLLLAAGRGLAWAGVGLVALLVIERGAVFALALKQQPTVALADLRKPPAGLTCGERITDFGQCADNRLTLSGVRLMGGYAGLTPRTPIDPTDPAWCRLAGVSWVTNHGQKLLPIDDPLPRVRLVEDDPFHAQGQADLVVDVPGRIVVRATTDEARLLVVAERWARGWTATVNGDPATVQAAHGAFLGCWLDVGTHEVVFTYRPQSRRVGGGLSLAGLLGLMLWCGWQARGPRR